ncbi:hypothetical protein [Neisseria animalis]|uniref:hypothetical protein n=1 Tax=Neisseria animalis TaxID=492 RepID=UPI000F4EBF8E|nr:hypothetical protein [Neisseria animalis]
MLRHKLPETRFHPDLPEPAFHCSAQSDLPTYHLSKHTRQRHTSTLFCPAACTRCRLPPYPENPKPIPP